VLAHCSWHEDGVHPSCSEDSVGNGSEVLLRVFAREVHSLVTDCDKVNVAMLLGVLRFILKVVLDDLVCASIGLVS
jgi:hypothetical protein